MVLPAGHRPAGGTLGHGAITDPVVGTLRSQKETRQFTFTTHNANVAVGADAELNIVLEAGADKGTITLVGGVDNGHCQDVCGLL
jgi:hypothetical protein